MGIYLNGGDTSPTRVYHNGTELEKVYCNGTLVWQRWPSVYLDAPATIPLIKVSTSDGKTTYLRNATKESLYLFADGSYGVLYRCDYTLEITLPRYAFATLTYSLSAGDVTTLDLMGGVGRSESLPVASVSGVPDGFAIERASFAPSMTFYIAKSNSEFQKAYKGDFSGIEHGIRTVQLNLSSESIGGTLHGEFVQEGDYAYFYYTSGLIHQGTGLELILREA